MKQGILKPLIHSSMTLCLPSLYTTSDAMGSSSSRSGGGTGRPYFVMELVRGIKITEYWDGTAKLWNVASGQEMFTHHSLSVGWGQAFSPDGLTWAIASSRGLALLRRASDAAVQAQK